jgi:hypothetical protein
LQGRGQTKPISAASFSIRELIAIITAAIAGISAAIAATITGAIIATTVPTAAVDTARRRSIGPAAGRRRRRRRNIGLAAATVPVIATASIPGGAIATGEEAESVGPGRGGRGSECERCH